MSIQDFAITTNHPNFEYRPGQQVRGKVHFRLDSPKKVRGNVYCNIRVNIIILNMQQVFMFS